MAHQSNLESRLVALLDVKVNRKKLGRTATVLATLAAVCLMLPLASVRGQSTSGRGTLMGIVTDPSGAVIPSVTVLASNLDAHTQETAICNPAGEYILKSVPPGHYTLEVMIPGFKVFRQTDVVLNANATQRLDVQMELGKISERLEVIGKKPPTNGISGGVVGGIGGGIPGGVQAGVPHRIRVGGNVIAAKLVSKVDPIYPEY